ncbi:FixH family protein [Maritimibacter sp. DP1N21-5]|uniref:FixH family protein n=1 Tax=Maritimibacter sp. DP1N21-5 TaxID=2836867 RepID=UPI001C438B38|nr:FixH family protein [Maritimibacter sp. DP1N21-5]MBV7408514.1 FixH family protein [Maritimibacter sp. DP1N21-5]
MSVVEQEHSGRKLTGWHVLAIFVSAFAVIIGVNVFMAVQAVSTFPGLETKNSYVASQQFDADRAAQEALGWTVEPGILGTQLSLRITDETGLPVEVAEIGGILGRATHVLDDQEPEFIRTMTGAYVAEVGQLDYGKWEMRLSATAADGTRYRKLIELFVPKS